MATTTKHTIEVRDHGDKCRLTSGDSKAKVIAVIKRKIWAEVIGNFNPIFCRYKLKRTQVHADGVDISDPFRMTDDQLQKPYISV
jgi:hypothetical protein